jgi:hypothetical protein
MSMMMMMKCDHEYDEYDDEYDDDDDDDDKMIR